MWKCIITIPVIREYHNIIHVLGMMYIICMFLTSTLDPLYYLQLLKPHGIHVCVFNVETISYILKFTMCTVVHYTYLLSNYCICYLFSFGITPTMEKLHHKGVMCTRANNCQFVCIAQSDYYRILHQVGSE